MQHVGKAGHGILKGVLTRPDKNKCESSKPF